MVEVYVMNIGDLSDPLEQPKIMEGLADYRKEKILRCRQASARKQCLGAGLLLQEIMKCKGISGKEITFGVHGKPETDGICFNLSHSHDMVVCATSDMPVGCDIERVKEASFKLVERFFSVNERKYLESFTQKERNREFFRLWTMKESYMKMTGEGMSLALDEFEIQIESQVSVYRAGAGQNCFFKEYAIDGYALTVCAQEETFSQNINIVMTK